MSRIEHRALHAVRTPQLARYLDTGSFCASMLSTDNALPHVNIGQTPPRSHHIDRSHVSNAFLVAKRTPFPSKTAPFAMLDTSKSCNTEKTIIFETMETSSSKGQWRLHQELQVVCSSRIRPNIGSSAHKVLIPVAGRMKLETPRSDSHRHPCKICTRGSVSGRLCCAIIRDKDYCGSVAVRL